MGALCLQQQFWGVLITDKIIFIIAMIYCYAVVVIYRTFQDITGNFAIVILFDNKITVY